MAVDVVGVGLAVVDLKATVTSIPKSEETVLVLDFHKHHGGPVANALVTLQRLGLKTSYMGKLGNDEYGNFIADGMKTEGIDTGSLCLADGESTPFSMVLVDASTKARSIAFNPGCALTVSEEHIDPGTIKSARLLHADLFTPAVRAACEIAREAGIPISVDADGLYPGLEELLELATIFMPAREIGCELVGEEDPCAAAEKLLKKYNLDLVVVTRGKKGSVTVTADETVEAPAFQVEAADTTGAGGVFQGAYLYGYLQGWPHRRAAQFANAAAAIMVSGMNGWGDIPTLGKVEKFLKEHSL
ncbi:MAG: carbohydrate kinase family protein [Candidatus Abyssobacteria bacterium SURF_5]|uniref:Carbohydrate kinase family protein n=1 Tax=Abyssobacteria bacterium (strain SURF_5) TaxID=2093360 RepID=A0A3A4P5Q8_ABYX5|nr:MAG: carbohydrate kinase family protein [Candidatus Abyssubacteria bacterium SURF_5]